MSDPYVGEIRMVGFNFAPQGWALCNGQTLPISQYAALFSLLGTTYGGNGTSNFQLPNLQGRVAIHQGTGVGLPAVVIGESAGSVTASLSAQNLPQHTHPIPASNDLGTTDSPGGAVVAKGGSYATPSDQATTAAATGLNTGSALPFNVQNPYLVVNFIIALVGIFPTRS
jgi:microcystin-dependent protein